MGEHTDVTRHVDDDPDDVEWVRERPDRPLVVVEPDPTWPQAYADVATRVRTALGDRVLALDHVGSTAVPGLPAKPVIDVDLTVADSSDEPSYVPALERVGFLLQLREPAWHQHRVLVGEQPPTNLHIWSPGSPEAVRHRIFRDWLIEHPDDRDRYVAAKRAAAGATADVAEYNRHKQDVIREILDRAFRANGLL